MVAVAGLMAEWTDDLAEMKRELLKAAGHTQQLESVPLEGWPADDETEGGGEVDDPMKPPPGISIMPMPPLGSVRKRVQ